MMRRKFLKVSAAEFLALAGGRGGRSRPPDHLPILDRKLAAEGYRPYYEEREITEPTLLCDHRGRLNPAAVGWSRRPLVRANLSGHWPRKKRWNFWNWIAPAFVFSVTVADIDFAAFCSAVFTDFATKKEISAISFKRSGAVPMPEEVERSLTWKDGRINFTMINEGGDIPVRFQGPRIQGGEFRAEFTILKPPGHETLNIVVPWSAERFQLNSKHNTLPVEGWVEAGGRRYEMRPEECHGVHDFGRGLWPYRSYWNWGVVTGKQGNDSIGVNFGAKWTTGTGVNENAVCFNGRLYKVMEDLAWEYDRNDWSKPWRVRADHSKMLDLTLTPFYAKTTRLNLGLLATGGTCSFGRWNGTLQFQGRTVEVNNLVGWAEEFSHRW